VAAVEREGNNLKGFQDFYLNMAQEKALTVLCEPNSLDSGLCKRHAVPPLVLTELHRLCTAAVINRGWRGTIHTVEYDALIKSQLASRN